MLTFATPEDRRQADQLMQPTLIRVIDNLRKCTEAADWQSEYVERVLWPATATEEQKQQVQALAAQLETADPKQVTQLRQQLRQLPTPLPTYEFRLTHEGQTAVLDIWQLCFQVCFWDYEPTLPARIDTTLLDAAGDIDWIALDDKTKTIVGLAVEPWSRGKPNSN
jgi:hypothetical protein